MFELQMKLHVLETIDARIKIVRLLDMRRIYVTGKTNSVFSHKNSLQDVKGTFYW